MCEMVPDMNLKGKMESTPEVHFSKEIVPAPPSVEHRDFQPAISEFNACATESLAIKKTPLSNGNVDMDVDVTGCSNSGKTMVVEVASEDVTECSSSFGGTCSGSENDNCSTFSDIEVQSQIYSGNASSPMCDDCFEPIQRRKKKLTKHWRRFINPLMWRCKWIEVQLKQLKSQALRYNEELALYNHRKQHEFAKFSLDKFGTKSVPFSGSIDRNKVMKRKRRERVEAECDLASYMSNHSLFSYYGNESLDGVAHLKEAPDVAACNGANSEEFWWTDILSSHESKCDDESLKDIILKIEAVHVHVHRLKTRIDTIISENPGKFTSVNELSMHGPPDRVNYFDRYPMFPASAKGKNASPVRSVKTKFNMGDLHMPGNEVSSCLEMSPLIEVTSKPQQEVLCENTKEGGAIQNQAANGELQTSENVRNELVNTTDELVEERKSISPAPVLEPNLPTEIAATKFKPLLTYQRRRWRKLR